MNEIECTCSKGAPSTGNRPCLHCGGDNSWCAKHYPAPQETMRDYRALWVCTDCIMHAANGECGDCYEGHQGGVPMAFLTPHAAVGATQEGHDCGRENDTYFGECDCETIMHSTRPCDGCGSHYHGERHAMTEWV